MMIADNLQIAALSLTVPAILLNVLCIKQSKFTWLILYIECIFGGLMPIKLELIGWIEDARLIIIPCEGVLKLLCVCERYISRVIFINGCIATLSLLVCPIFLANDSILLGLCFSAIGCLGFFAISCFCAYLVNYFGDLLNRLESNFGENRCNLDNMHEGLLILTANDREELFCNIQAVRFFD